MPKAKSFVCKKCGRKFLMAAHLARHSGTHESKRPTGKSRPTNRHVRTRRTPFDPVGNLVASLRDSHRSLLSERETLNGQIAALESALAAMGAASARRNGRTTARTSSEYRTGSLKAHIQKVLSDAGSSMRVTEITAGVIKSGFKSKNKTLGTSVGIALADMPTVRRVKRGVYGLR